MHEIVLDLIAMLLLENFLEKNLPRLTVELKSKYFIELSV